MNNIWKLFLQTALPWIHAAGQSFRDQDSNDTGKDDIEGYALLAIADIAQAVISGDVSKMQAALNKVQSPVK